MASAPPAVGVKVNVAGTFTMPATRKAESMVNEIETTAVGEEGGVDVPAIAPDETGAEAAASVVVCTVTSPPAWAAPIVKPDNVTVTAVDV